MYKHPDLHLHSTFSDGTDSPFELLEKIRNTDIDIFSLTDHDSYLGCMEMKNYLRSGDPLFLDGIEISCKDEFGDYHMLGYCCDLGNAALRDAIEIVHAARLEKTLNRIRYLENVHHFSFSQTDVDWILQQENPGRPHFVALLLKKGYITDKSVGFAIMGEYQGKERRYTPKEAIDAILAADGIPVLAHGIYADGTKHLTQQEVTERVERLKDCGLMGLEGYYSAYSKEETRMMLSLAEKYDLLISAGSDYHGSAKTVALGDAGTPDPQRLMPFFSAAVQRLAKASTKPE